MKIIIKIINNNKFKMFNDEKFKNLFKETLDFNTMLFNFVVTANQINMNNDLLNIYQNYDLSIRQILKNLVECNMLKNNKDNICFKNFKEEFELLRSETSKTIEKL